MSELPRPADDQPADDQPADDQPADDQPADDQPVDEAPGDEHPVDEAVRPDPTASGDPRVAAAVRRLEELGDSPPEEHVEVYEQVHQVLQETLGDAQQDSSATLDRYDKG